MDANLEQLKAGLAWYYRDYAHDVSPENRPLYEAAEAEARAAKRGLWRSPQPQEPWALRNPSSSASPPASSPRSLLGNTTTGAVRGNRNSRIYHLPECPSYGAVAERNRVPFQTEAVHVPVAERGASV